LIAARDLAIANDERQNGLFGSIASVPKRPRGGASQQAISQLLMPVLTRGGFPFDQFERIQGQRRAELQRIVEGERAHAIKESSSARVRLRDAAASDLKGFEAIADPSVFVLDTPFLIWGYAIWGDAHPVEASHIEARKSWAKIRMDEHSRIGSTYYLTFFFIWDNPRDQWIITNIDANVTVNGYCQLYSYGAIHGDSKGLYLSGVLHPRQY